jgi:cytochrome c oxidase assembly protein Cox11
MSLLKASVSCFVSTDISSSKRLAMENLQNPDTADIRRIILSGTFHPASQTKTGVFNVLSQKLGNC